jgi:hypothetical protein
MGWSSIYVWYRMKAGRTHEEDAKEVMRGGTDEGTDTGIT